MENEVTKRIAEEATKLKDLQDKRKALEDEAEELKKQEKEQEQLVASLLCDAELTSIETSNVTYTLATECFASLIAGSKMETIAEFKKDEELSALVKEEVNAKTFSSYIKEYKKEHVGKLPELLQTLLDNKKISIFEPYKIKIKAKK